MATRTIIITALKTGTALVLTLSVVSIDVSVWIVYAPIIEPVILNLPPPSELPPRATANITSISILGTIVYGFTVCTLLAWTNPAIPTQRPNIANVNNLILAGLRPLRLEALSLMPTARVYSPRLVNFNTRTVTAITTIVMSIG